MPSFKKKALSLYLRTGCQRQLALNLYGDTERRERGMPSRQTARAGLGLVAQAGYEWQDEKVGELDRVFGTGNVLINPKKERNRPGTLVLQDVLPLLEPYQFVVEGRYDAETHTFKEAIGISDLRDSEGSPLDIGRAFPDLIQVLPPMTGRPEWEVATEETGPTAVAQEVLASGDTRPLLPNDTRLRLRVIDIKQASEPGAHYFAEVVYYSITLASWLIEHGWTDRFVVVAAPAVWPGSYEASEIMQARERCRKEGREPTPEELARALEDDLEIAPFDAFAPRLRRFFQEELPHVLQTAWDQLPWHVFYACNGCEFLGYPWLDRDGKPTNEELHCWPTADRTEHLSRVAGLSRASAKLLGPTAADVSALSNVAAAHASFNASPTLRAKRTVYPHRARSLRKAESGIIPDSGSDALMPRWPDLHIYIFLDYDLSSAVTAAFSLRAFWKEPLPFGSSEAPDRKRWAALDEGKRTSFQEVFLVDQRRSLERERQELLKFLRTLRSILDTVRQQDEADVSAGRRGDPNEPTKLRRSTYQIYLWDEAQRKHLVRVIGRHLDAILADSSLRDLAWLFPPPSLLVHADEASYKSPFTLVSNVVQNTVAVPVPHHYTLLEVVRTYRPETTHEMNVHPLYREPLSDLIPGERIHEMWEHRGDWLQTAATIKETTGKKLTALAHVVAKLEQDLKGVLSRAAAPPLVRASSRLAAVPPYSELWHEYARLNAALDELDDHSVRAMPPHEREARFKSAHLLRRLEGDEKIAAHTRLQAAAQQTLPLPSELMIYALNPDSRGFNVRPPAIGYALAPRVCPAFLGQAAYPLIKDHDIKVPGSLRGSVADAGLTKVSVQAIDRVHLLIALKPSHTNCVPALEGAGIVDLSTDAMLDPVGEDYLTKKIRITLLGIGRPASAQHDAATLRALGITAPEEATTPESPSSEFLWQAPALAATPLERDTVAAREALEASGIRLNASQWAAWEAALSRRLALIWGPPGTGKSQTLRAVVAGAVWLAHRAGNPLRILIASGTYAAVDNVLIGADELLERLLPEKPYRLFRVQSQENNPPAELTAHRDIVPVSVKTTQAPQEVLGIQDLLEHPREIIVVAGPSQQLHNLAIATKNKTKKETPDRTQRRWFDLVLIDEASQLDVAESTLVVSKAADGAAFVLAGDDKQLPPIHPAVPPEDLDFVVGSIYGYIRHHHKVAYQPLQENYRSCQTIVEFTKQAGYDPGLHAHHADLRLALLGGALPTLRPSDWPDALYWTPAWTDFLEPAKPAVCFIYDDELAGQSNDFEADAVAALIWLLYGRIDRQLAGELDEEGRIKALTGRPHDAKSFWERAVGVVTPHRAQMGNIVARLQTMFPDHDAAAIWSAVDTVERFQGQQRDIIVASFGLGDPDLIRAEDDFLYSLNRFNVMASRARAKLIVLTTRTLVDHLADDAEVLEESRLLKNFAESFCQDPTPVTFGYRIGGVNVLRPGVLRSR
ncbi:MAG: AAA domain-containing protein [Chloroflexota bacterium]|nr:AAA domain-containing protein [Chloroflexota bacterium]